MKRATAVLFILTTLLTACEQDTESFNLGLDLVESKSEISVVDSFSVKLSTIKLDSIPTSGTDILLVGQLESETTGQFEVNGYFNFDRQSSLLALDEEAIFDSITIQLNYADYTKGDTAQMQSIAVFRLTQQIEFQENDYSEQYLFNTTSFPCETVPCGQHDFIYQSENDYIEFRLDDEFGKELVALAREDDAEEFINNDNFKEYLKGFVLKPGENAPQSVIGFSSDSVLINMYFHTVGLETTETTIQFTLADENSQFNGVKADREGTAFADLSSQREEMNSKATGDVSYIQGGAGIIVRVDFPSLNDIFALKDRVLLKAELILRPAPESYSGDMPEALDFYETDRVNQIGDQLTYTSNNAEYSLQAYLNEDELYNENSYYTVDISRFISSALAGAYYDTNNGLLVTVPYSDLLSKADQLILEGESSSRNNPTLNLYFLTFE
ncbi:DUF4270 family protein [Sunxiuqinia indica]|uniref:DUF4270 family protein n=1 Tax=Sunxiuqinia indica TaxID=2692584 RepID=UPI00135A3A57|nr:DUF4270 family protein [Sunxiuqinia indica]